LFIDLITVKKTIKIRALFTGEQDYLSQMFHIKVLPKQLLRLKKEQEISSLEG